MNEYNIEDTVKYISNNNDVKEGIIVRYLRNGNIIIKNENNNEKITIKNLVGNITSLNNLINYTKDLEYYYYNNLNYITELEYKIDRVEYIKFIMCIATILLSIYIIVMLAVIFYTITIYL